MLCSKQGRFLGGVSWFQNASRQRMDGPEGGAASSDGGEQAKATGAKMPAYSLTLNCGELVKGLALLRCLNWLLERLGCLLALGLVQHDFSCAQRPQKSDTKGEH